MKGHQGACYAGGKTRSYVPQELRQEDTLEHPHSDSEHNADPSRFLQSLGAVHHPGRTSFCSSARRPQITRSLLAVRDRWLCSHPQYPPREAPTTASNQRSSGGNRAYVLSPNSPWEGEKAKFTLTVGPTAFGRIPGFTDHIFPETSLPFLNLVSELGLVLFLFLVGLEYVLSP